MLNKQIGECIAATPLYVKNVKEEKNSINNRFVFLLWLSVQVAQSGGKLHITSDAKGANIFIDDEKKGIVGGGVTIIT